jgi:hypothetical protein
LIIGNPYEITVAHCGLKNKPQKVLYYTHPNCLSESHAIKGITNENKNLRI